MSSRLDIPQKSTLGAGKMKRAAGPSVSMSLPHVDPKQLKARLYSHPPKQVTGMNTMAFRINKATNSQLRNNARPNVPKLEPLVSDNDKLHFVSQLSALC